MEQAALRDEPFRWLLDVEDPGAGSHPLGVAIGDHAAAAVRIVVLEDAVDQVGDGLEPAMRMPGRALGLTGRVIDLAHLVEVDERIEFGKIHAGERAADREALPLETLGRDRDALDGALPGDEGIRRCDAGKDGDVVNSDGRHENGSCLAADRPPLLSGPTAEPFA